MQRVNPDSKHSTVDIGNINRCSEWGAPRVPAIHVEGGDDWTQGSNIINPRPTWSKETMSRVKDGQVKRIQYWTEEEPNEDVDHDVDLGRHDDQKPSKRARMSGDSSGGEIDTHEQTKRQASSIDKAPKDKVMPPSIARAVEEFRCQHEEKEKLKLLREPAKSARMEQGPGEDDDVDVEVEAAAQGQAHGQLSLETAQPSASGQAATKSAGRLIVAADGAVTEVTAPEAAQPLPAPMGAADLCAEY